MASVGGLHIVPSDARCLLQLSNLFLCVHSGQHVVPRRDAAFFRGWLASVADGCSRRLAPRRETCCWPPSHPSRRPIRSCGRLHGQVHGLGLAGMLEPRTSLHLLVATSTWVAAAWPWVAAADAEGFAYAVGTEVPRHAVMGFEVGQPGLVGLYGTAWQIGSLSTLDSEGLLCRSICGTL
jgi:hypothetical protein